MPEPLVPRGDELRERRAYDIATVPYHLDRPVRWRRAIEQRAPRDLRAQRNVQRVRDRREHVHGPRQPVLDAAPSLPRQLDEERDERDLVQTVGGRLAPRPPGQEVHAVVGDDDDQRAVVEPPPLEPVEEHPEARGR